MTQTSPKPTQKQDSDSGKGKTSHKPSPFNSLSSEAPGTKLEKQGGTNPLDNLSLSAKQLLTLILSEIFSLGLVGAGIYFIAQSGKSQLVNQAKSEIVVTEINYNIKVNQMGFGFRGQSDNVAIIAAAKTRAEGKPLPPELERQVKQILLNEVKARKIEYATLVGVDRRIIVNANERRTGDLFDPNRLVSEVIKKPEQIKTSEIVKWNDLSREAPTLPTSFSQQDALIRYTGTPVKDPVTKKVIGVLVSGDIVDGKSPIVEQTVAAFQGGYSAVYRRNPNGTFALATSSLLNEGDKITQALPRVPLPDESLLIQAVENPGQTVTKRQKVGEQTLTLAAKTLSSEITDQPVSILVRGTPETTLNALVQENIRHLLVAAIFAVLLDILLALWLKKLTVKRLEKLQKSTERFMKGDGQFVTDVQGQDEIAKLATTFKEMGSIIKNNENQLRKEAEQSRIVGEITSASTLSDEEIKKAFDTALQQALNIMAVDRVVVYRFEKDGKGKVVYEALNQPFPSAVKEKITDYCIPQYSMESYKKGKLVANANIKAVDYHPQHINLLERLQVKANLMVPILNQGEVYGLLIAHHCRNTHEWSQQEMTFFKQLSVQLGINVERFSLFKQQIAEANRAELLKNVTLKIAAALKPEQVFEQATQEIRVGLQTQRVVIYRFEENWKGTVIAESVAPGWPKALGATIFDPCFADNYVQKYKQGRVQATPDIYQAGLTDCHIKQLEPFSVQANLVAPILVDGSLQGLLIAHECVAPRYWDKAEIILFAQLATQIGLAVERTELQEKQLLSEKEQRLAREFLQRRALELLMEVEPVSKGDLTIRAQVTPDEIGTIADSYNATIESLRRLVTQVQLATQEVSQTTNSSDNSIQLLTSEALRQSEEIKLALEKIQAMTQSIQAIAANAEEVEQAVLFQNQTVKKGDLTMDQTVEGILTIRETVAETAIKVQRLGESSQKVSKVVNLISKFAAQTHMLALKASIEAARAGEQGQGFAVIADEVRTLAAQSAEATTDIEKLVSEIQLETQEVLKAMEVGTQQVISGTELVEQTRQSLNQITAASAKINQLVVEISTAAVEQSEASDVINETMNDVAGIAEKTAAMATDVSVTFRELLKLAQALEKDTARFKVK